MTDWNIFYCSKISKTPEYFFSIRISNLEYPSSPVCTKMNGEHQEVQKINLSQLVISMKDKCYIALSSKVTIRFLASILGSLEFFRWGCPIAALHYRGLQRNINFFLSRNMPYSCKVSISEEARSDLD